MSSSTSVMTSHSAAAHLVRWQYIDRYLHPFPVLSEVNHWNQSLFPKAAIADASERYILPAPERIKTALCGRHRQVWGSHLQTAPIDWKH
jgi:hypothetical protein